MTVAIEEVSAESIQRANGQKGNAMVSARENTIPGQVETSVPTILNEIPKEKVHLLPWIHLSSLIN